MHAARAFAENPASLTLQVGAATRVTFKPSSLHPEPSPASTEPETGCIFQKALCKPFYSYQQNVVFPLHLLKGVVERSEIFW